MKQYVKLFEEFITEGGWSTTKTETTAITPDIIEKVVKVMDQVKVGFEKHCESIELPPVDFFRPIGSGTWWQEDLQTQPDKTYGDVDYLVAYPTLKISGGKERDDEIATVKLYNAELMVWIGLGKVKEIDIKESQAISTASSVKLVVVVDMKEGNEGYVQVDLVISHKQYIDWALFRFTPMRDVKGFVMGKLYSSFGDALDVSIQVRGVRAKFEGEIMQPYARRAGVEDILISADVNNFMIDIAKFFWNQAEGEQGRLFSPAPTLANWKGMNPASPTFEDFIEGIKGVADTLEQLGEFGTTIKYKNGKDFLLGVAKMYEKNMMTGFNSTKFNKAQSDEARARAEKIKGLIKEYVHKANSLLK